MFPEEGLCTLDVTWVSTVTRRSVSPHVPICLKIYGLLSSVGREIRYA